MENKVFNVLVNFEGTDSLTSDPISLVKGDYNSIDLVFQINRTYDIAMFYLVSPSGSTYVTAINNGRVTFREAEIFSEKGLYEFGVSIYDNDSKLTNVQTGKINVVDNIMTLSTDITQTDNYKILDDMIKDICGIQEEYHDMDARIAEYNANASNKLNTFNVNYDEKLQGFNANVLTIEEDAEATTGITFNEWGNSKRIEEFIKDHFSITPDYGVYTVRFPLWETSHTCVGEKLDDNIGKYCNPATDTVKEDTNYGEAWNSYDCNAVVDANGVRHITAIKGMPNFQDTGRVDVFCLFRTYYQKIWEENGYLYISRSFVPREGYTVVPQAINKDGSINNWFVIGKYVVGDIPDGNTHKLYSSKGLVPAHNISSPQGSEEISDSISHTGCISLMRAKGSNYYSAGTLADYMHILTTFYLKFATKNTQSIMAGNTSNSFQYRVAQAENNVNRVILTTSQANNFDINTCVSVGNPNTATNYDRAYGYMHNIAYNVRIIGKEVVDSTKTALILDHAPFNVPETGYVTSMHERSGYSDYILGRTGSIGSNTNGKHGFVLDGIEIAVGGYEVVGNAFMDIINASSDREVYYTNDASKLTTNMTTAKSTYKKSPYIVEPEIFNAWNYITKESFDTKDGVFFPVKAGQTGSGTEVGYADGFHPGNGTSGQREFLLLGALYADGLAGLSCLTGNAGVSASFWHILARLSINGVGGELAE